MRYLFLFLSTVLFFTNSNAQRTCGASHAHDEMIENHPELAKQLLLQEKELQKRIAQNRNRKNVEEVYTVPIVIHVIHIGEAEGQGNNISDAQIQSGLTAINEAFRNGHGQSIDTKIQFELASIDTNGNATSGITRFDASGVPGYATDGVFRQSVGAAQDTIKALTGWPAQHYYNIWLVNEIDGNDGGFGIQGYAYFPGAPRDLDGTLMLNTGWGNIGTANVWNNQSKTAIHELGHALDLYHTFEGDDSGDSCPAETNGCGSGTGDCCEDTSPHIRSGSDCPSGDTNTCTGAVYDDVIHNYMDYSSQNCQYMFSQDQKNRMRAALEGPRESLLKTLALSDTALNFSAPVAASCTPVTQNLDGNYMGIERLEFNQIIHESWYARSDNPTEGYVDETSRAIETAYLFTDSTYNFELTNLANPAEAKAWIDFNNDGSFNNTNELIFDEQVEALGSTNADVTIPNTGITLNQTLRMRVIIDFNAGSVPDACDNPQYGQGIDFPVVLKSNATAPEADFTLSDSTICVGDTITFSDNSIGIVDSRSWTFQDGTPNSSTDETVQVVFNSAGTKDISLTVTNSFGTDVINEANLVVVNDNPATGLPSDTSACANTSITLDAGDGFTSYEWVGLNNNQTLLVMFGTDYISRVSNADGCSSSDTVSVVFNANPVVTSDNNFPTSYPLDHGMVDLTFGSPQGGLYSGPYVSGGQFNPSSAGLGDHDIKYVYTTEDGCKDSVTVSLEVQIATSVLNISGDNFNIYPNPVQDNFIISSSFSGNANYIIYDITGKVIQNGIISDSTQEISSALWQNGIYFLEISNGSTAYSVRLIKVK